MVRAGKKKRAPESPNPSERDRDDSVATPKVSASADTAPRIRTIPAHRKWLYRIVAMTLAPLFVVCGSELVLRWIGYGESRSFFLDGSRAGQPDVWVDNLDFARWVFPKGLEPTPRPTPFALPQQKAPDVCRLMVFGESAAMGFPEPSISFTRVLDLLLQDRYPSTRFEVLNTAMVAINSHVARQIALQALKRQPDVLIVYLGNNEVVGPFGAAGVLGPISPSLNFIRTSLWIKSTRLGQWLGNVLDSVAGGGSKPQSWKGMSSFVNCRLTENDSRLDRIRDHFRANLRDICEAAIAQGIPVVLCTIPVNLRDCAPFASEHSTGLSADQLARWQSAFDAGCALQAEKKYADALARFDEAAAVDEAYAELAFRRGRCHAALGNSENARESFERARDLDVLRFRSDTSINRIVREVAAEFASAGVRLADAEQTFAERSADRTPGSDLFLEHVHMAFSGNYIVAQTVFDALNEPTLPVLGTANRTTGGLTESQCRQRLAHTERNELKIVTTINEMYQHMPPFTFQYNNSEQAAEWSQRESELQSQIAGGGLHRSIAECRVAVEQHESDWMLHMKLGDLLAEARRSADAAEEYEHVIRLIPHFQGAHFMLGEMHVALQQPEDAQSHYREAIRLDPNYLEAYLRLARVYELQRDFVGAESVFASMLRANPGRAHALGAVGAYYMRLGRLEEAKAKFVEAAKIEPDNFEAHAQIGLAAQQLGQREEAIKHLERAVQLQPSDVRAAAMLQQLRAAPGGRSGQESP